jgi:hypothetical protein
MGSNLNLEICRRQADPASAELKQNVGQDRERVAPLDDAAHGLKWRKQNVALQGYWFHLFN